MAQGLGAQWGYGSDTDTSLQPSQPRFLRTPVSPPSEVCLLGALQRGKAQVSSAHGICFAAPSRAWGLWWLCLLLHAQHQPCSPGTSAVSAASVHGQSDLPTADGRGAFLRDGFKQEPNQGLLEFKEAVTTPHPCPKTGHDLQLTLSQRNRI